MVVVSSYYNEDNLAQVLAGAEGITSAIILGASKYLAKLVANIGRVGLESTGNHEVFIQQLQAQTQDMAGAAERAAQPAYVKDTAGSITRMGRAPTKKGGMDYKSVGGIPKLKEKHEYTSWNDILVNGIAQLFKEMREAMQYFMKVASRGVMIRTRGKSDNYAESFL